MGLKMLLVALVFVHFVGEDVHAMTLTLYGGKTDPTKTFDIDAVSQRCYNIGSCFHGPNTSATWNGAKRHTKVVFYSSAFCQAHQAIGSGTPDGALYFQRANFDQNVASFMIWETGVFATSGVENACYVDENAKVNATEEASIKTA